MIRYFKINPFKEHPVFWKITVILLVFTISAFKTSNIVQGTGYAIKTVVIDAGHGGKDPGCIGANSKEKDVALALVLKVGALISKSYPEINVIYTRDTDKFVELYERAKIANRNKADLFISIHCNANTSKSASGTETFVMGLHKSEANLEVAKRENGVIILEDDYNDHYDGFNPNSPEAHILFSLYQNAHLGQSISLASKIEDKFKTDLKLNSRGVKQAGFLVLYKTSMPSLLIESGFLTNADEEKFLNSEAGQTKLSNAIFRAFNEYKGEMEEGIIIEKKPDQIPDKNEEKISPVKKDTVVTPVNGTKVQTNTGNNKEVVYKIQISSSGVPLDITKSPYNKLQKTEVEEINGLFKYVTGAYSSLELAIRDIQGIRDKGFKDAFIVAYHKGKRITMKQADEILKE